MDAIGSQYSEKATYNCENKRRYILFCLVVLCHVLVCTHPRSPPRHTLLTRYHHTGLEAGSSKPMSQLLSVSNTAESSLLCMRIEGCQKLVGMHQKPLLPRVHCVCILRTLDNSPSFLLGCLKSQATSVSNAPPDEQRFIAQHHTGHHHLTPSQSPPFCLLREDGACYWAPCLVLMSCACRVVPDLI